MIGNSNRHAHGWDTRKKMLTVNGMGRPRAGRSSGGRGGGAPGGLRHDRAVARHHRCAVARRSCGSATTGRGRASPPPPPCALPPRICSPRPLPVDPNHALTCPVLSLQLCLCRALLQGSIPSRFVVQIIKMPSNKDITSCFDTPFVLKAAACAYLLDPQCSVTNVSSLTREFYCA